MKSEVRKLDFVGNPTAGESEINEWTKNKTNGKISKIFEPGNQFEYYNDPKQYTSCGRQNRTCRVVRCDTIIMIIMIITCFTVVGTIKQDSTLVLVSAVHFQNKWKNEFTNTKNAMFCVSAEEHIEVQMLHQTNLFKYYKDPVNKFAALELPYKVCAYFKN